MTLCSPYGPGYLPGAPPIATIRLVRCHNCDGRQDADRRSVRVSAPSQVVSRSTASSNRATAPS